KLSVVTVFLSQLPSIVAPGTVPDLNNLGTGNFLYPKFKRDFFAGRCPLIGQGLSLRVSLVGYEFAYVSDQKYVNEANLLPSRPTAVLTGVVQRPLFGLNCLLADDVTFAAVKGEQLNAILITRSSF